MKYLYETHLHTSKVSACATSTPAQQVRKYKDLGYAGVIITDHFVNGYSHCPADETWETRMRFFASGYFEARQEGEKCGLDVFFGWEYTIAGLDFLTYGLDLDFLIAHPDVDKLSIGEYSALVRQCGGYLAQAHPFRDAWYIANPGPVQPSYIDGVEVRNGMDSEISNNKALEFANEHNLPVQAGSDAHNINQMCYAGIALQRKAESIYDIIRDIKDKKAEIISLEK